jgi:glutamine amidotransferase
MQLLFERSEEGEPTAGLGLLGGEVTWLRSGGLRLPHIGWNEVRFERSSLITAPLPAGGCPFYHVHSLVPRPSAGEHVIATTEYGERFTTIVQSGNVYGVQFHPEKSSRHGLEMLAAFVGICAQAPGAGMVPGPGTFASRA